MSKLNRFANYIYDVDGETTWERLRVIRNFIQDRRLAYEIALESREKLINQPPSRIKDVELVQLDGNIQDCAEEIAFLIEFESRLALEAEQTRIPGKTDNEMYEINFYHEHTLRLITTAQAERISCGIVSVDTVKRLLRNKTALDGCIQMGIFSQDMLTLPQLGASNIQAIALLSNPNNYLSNKTAAL